MAGHCLKNIFGKLMTTSKSLHAMAPRMARRDTGIDNPKLPNKTANHLRPIPTAFSEFIWRQLGEYGAVVLLQSKLQKTTLFESWMNWNNPLRSRRFHRASFRHDFYAPDAVN